MTLVLQGVNGLKYKIMGDILQVLAYVICGIIFLWLGHFLFFGPPSPLYPYMPWGKKNDKDEKQGSFQTCPICCKRMLRGELVKTTAFATGALGKDYIVHIKGCLGCLESGLPRRCPICKIKLSLDDYLISRMFERNFKKNHIHVLGCNHCRKR